MSNMEYPKLLAAMIAGCVLPFVAIALFYELKRWWENVR